MKKLLPILALAFAVCLVSCSESEKFKQCKAVFETQTNIINKCQTCDELEDYYINIDEKTNWETMEKFLGQFVETDDFIGWYDIDQKENDKLQIIYDDFKVKINERFTALGCESEAVRAYKVFYQNYADVVLNCNNYKEYNTFIERYNNADAADYLGSYTLTRINSLKGVTDNDNILINNLKEECETKIAATVAQFKADEEKDRKLAIEKEKKELVGKVYATEGYVPFNKYSFLSCYESLATTFALFGLHAMTIDFGVEFTSTSKCNLYTPVNYDLRQCKDRGEAIFHSMWSDKLNEPTRKEENVDFTYKNGIIHIKGNGDWRLSSDKRTLIHENPRIVMPIYGVVDKK